MLWTKRGYRSSVIFSLLAKSNALSNGILFRWSVSLRRNREETCLRSLSQHSPNAFQVHGANLDDMPYFLTLENSISSASRHAGNIEQLSSIDHMVVCVEDDASVAGRYRG